MKRVYVTVLSDDSYYKGVVALDKSLKSVNVEYPLIVLVTDSVSSYIVDRLKKWGWGNS